MTPDLNGGVVRGQYMSPATPETIHTTLCPEYPQTYGVGYAALQEVFPSLPSLSREQICKKSTWHLETDVTNEWRLRLRAGDVAGAKTRFQRESAARLASSPNDFNYSRSLALLGNAEAAERVRSKPAKMSPLAKHRVREGCELLEKRHGRKPSFLTVTLPGSTYEAASAFAGAQRDILKNLLQAMRREYYKLLGAEADAKTFDYVRVSELQERDGKSKALHMHMVIALNVPGLHKAVKEKLQGWWQTILENASDKMGVDLFARQEGGTWRGVDDVVQVDCKRLRKSAGRYLSQYMSKSKHNKDLEEGLRPASWWSCSKVLAAEMKEEREVLQATCPNDFAGEQLFMYTAWVLSQAAEHVILKTNPFTGIGYGYSFYMPEHLSEKQKKQMKRDLLELSADDSCDDEDTLCFGPEDSNGKVYTARFIPGIEIAVNELSDEAWRDLESDYVPPNKDTTLGFQRSRYKRY